MEDHVPDIPGRRMTEAEFVAWDEARGSEARVEFHEGFVVTMQAETNRHSFAKNSVANQFFNQLGFGGPCYPYGDGMRVRTPEGNRYEPDAMIRCGDPLGGDGKLVTDPVVVVEVMSPSNSEPSMETKQMRYFSCASLEHFLLVNPVTRLFFHTVRGPAPDKYLTTVLRGGSLALDPPGVTLDLDAVLAAVDAA